MTVVGVRRGNAAFFSGCKSHPAIAPAGSNRSSHGGDEMAEAFGIACHELVSLDFRCGSKAEVQRRLRNVRCWGVSGSRFRATGGLLIAKSGLLGATQQGHCSPRSYSRSTACGRSRGRQNGAASMIGTRQATYDPDPPNELQVDCRLRSNARDIALALRLARSRRLRTCLVPRSGANLSLSTRYPGNPSSDRAMFPCQRAVSGKCCLA